MKILIDARRLGNNGIGRYLKGLISGLCDIKPENEYLVIYQQGCEAALSQLPDKIVPIQSSVDAYSIEEFTCLPKIINSTGADVFHSPHYTVPSMIPCASVTTVHDIIHVIFPEFVPDDKVLARIFGNSVLNSMNAIKSFLYYLLSSEEKDYLSKIGKTGLSYAYSMIKHAISVSDIIIHVSQTAAKDIGCRFFTKDKSIVIPNGVDQIFKYTDNIDKISFREKYGILLPYILCVTRHAPHKNIKGLLEMFINSGLPYDMSIDLVIIGEGISRYPEIIETAKDYGIERRVHFLQGVADKYLKSAYINSEYTIVPSLYEGFGFPAVEALSLGIPILSNTGGALSEICGEGAILASNKHDFIQHMRSLSINAHLRQELRIRTLDKKNRFDWRTAAMNTIEAYEMAYEKHSLNKQNNIISACSPPWQPAERRQERRGLPSG